MLHKIFASTIFQAQRSKPGSLAVSGSQSDSTGLPPHTRGSKLWRLGTNNIFQSRRMTSLCVVYNINQVKIRPNTIKFHLSCRTTCFELFHVISGSQFLFKTYFRCRWCHNATEGWNWPFISVYSEVKNKWKYTSIPPHAVIACTSKIFPLQAIWI
jgi:hypothetical protein